MKLADQCCDIDRLAQRPDPHEKPSLTVPTRNSCMAAISLELPTIQNWSCHNCGGCCRQHAIYVTESEEQRIVGQKWIDLPDWPVGQSLFVADGPRGQKRLAARSDGGCVFLDERGLCRIHAKFGEPAKPLACQIYPYAFHPAGAGLTVSLRFSCPSVVKNLGQPVEDQQKHLVQLARQVLPQDYKPLPPPELVRGQSVSWDVFLDCVDALDAMLDMPQTPLVLRLRRVLEWSSLLEQAPIPHLTGDKLKAMIELLYAECEHRIADEKATDADSYPTAVGQRLFRLAAGQYARHDTLAAKPTLKMRWGFFWSGILYARGKGLTPAPHHKLSAVPFSALDKSYGGLSLEMEQLLTRYLRVKVQGLHLCGRAAYGESLIDGMRTMTLVVSVMLWISKWVAASQGSKVWTLDDLIEAITIVDHNHAYSPAFGTRSSLSRVRMLQQLGDLSRLLVWTAR
jgi:lysine-N-methylase